MKEYMKTGRAAMSSKTRKRKDPNYGLTVEECARVEAFARSLFGETSETPAESEKNDVIERSSKKSSKQELEHSPMAKVGSEQSKSGIEAGLASKEDDRTETTVKCIIKLAGSREAALRFLSELCAK